MLHLSIATAFLAGIVSFVSPCVLPLVPSYLSFLTGTGLEELKSDASSATRLRALSHALFFVAGFTVVFMALGLTASAVGSALAEHKREIEIFGGIVIVLLGLQMLGILKIPALMRDTRQQVSGRKQSFALSFLIGIGFAAGWSPCIGPILSAILLLASQQKLIAAAGLLFVYALGLAVPFLITAAAITQALGALARIKRFLPAIEATSGAVMVATGIVVASGQLTRILGFFYQFIQVPSL
ncbi:MAG: cytochrome c biogenesis CcdA family protein [Vulcanimicrobiaceae bacterium]